MFSLVVATLTIYDASIFMIDYCWSACWWHHFVEPSFSKYLSSFEGDTDPVSRILMGECGCGKTELVRYLCAWSKLPLLTLNVHGGTTEEDMDQAGLGEKRSNSPQHG